MVFVSNSNIEFWSVEASVSREMFKHQEQSYNASTPYKLQIKNIVFIDIIQIIQTFHLSADCKLL